MTQTTMCLKTKLCPQCYLAIFAIKGADNLMSKEFFSVCLSFLSFFCLSASLSPPTHFSLKELIETKIKEKILCKV